jgi:hypothetical protein
VGDLYGRLTLNFTGSGFGTGSSLEFNADTDQLSQAIPEPSSWAALVGLGLVGGIVQLVRRRRKTV